MGSGDIPIKTVGGQSIMGSGDIPISATPFTSMTSHLATPEVLYSNDSDKTAFVIAQIRGGDSSTRIGATMQNHSLNYFPAPNGGDYTLNRSVCFVVFPHQRYSMHRTAGIAPSWASFDLYR